MAVEVDSKVKVTKIRWVLQYSLDPWSHDFVDLDNPRSEDNGFPYPCDLEEAWKFDSLESAQACASRLVDHLYVTDVRIRKLTTILE